jgi:deoxyribose-phosphate aldolase
MKKIFNYPKFLNSLNESSNPDSHLLSKIDYTLLKPEATEEQILELCQKADILGVKSVCVLPKMVKVAAEALEDSSVLVCTVVSFPEGTNEPEEKLAECKQVIADGADEVDMVLNYPLLKEKEALDNHNDFHNTGWDYDSISDELINEVTLLVDECHAHTNKDSDEIVLKVIVESGLLSKEETAESTHICMEAGADFIKTSTGMVAVGAELDKVQIMKRIIQEERSDMKIKASGGIKTMGDLQKFDPLVDRFGVGFTAVDSIFGNEEKSVGDGY